jgi:predicted RNA-binding Zn ribbon-like protein
MEHLPHGNSLPTDSRPPAIFIADAVALDFLNSVATPADAPVDWIDNGEGFVDWLEQARLVDPDVLKSLRARCSPDELDGVAIQARSLREWVRTFVSERKGRPLAAKDLGDLGPLVRLMERDQRFSQIVKRSDNNGAGGLERRSTRRWQSAESLLLPLGEALADFVCDEDFTHVKACEGPACTLMFADHTRGRARRWCSMAICGNRAKQSAHRERVKLAQRGQPH